MSSLQVEHNRLLSKRIDELDRRLELLEASLSDRALTILKRGLMWFSCHCLIPDWLVRFFFRLFPGLRRA